MLVPMAAQHPALLTLLGDTLTASRMPLFLAALLTDSQLLTAAYARATAARAAHAHAHAHQAFAAPPRPTKAPTAPNAPPRPIPKVKRKGKTPNPTAPKLGGPHKKYYLMYNIYFVQG